MTLPRLPPMRWAGGYSEVVQILIAVIPLAATLAVAAIAAVATHRVARR